MVAKVQNLVNLRQYEAPVAQVQFIRSDGEVLIYFSQDMKVLPELDAIEKNITVNADGESLPVLAVEVI